LGVDSTCQLVRYWQQGIRPDLIIFADIGDEKPETYAYLPVINAWLAKVDFPQVTVVRYQPKNFKNYPPYSTLFENCLTNGTLPGISFGPSTCSIKWKQSAIEAYIKNWKPAKDAWRMGERIRKVIGYDASPRDRQRFAHSRTIEDPRYEYHYPLVEDGITRPNCVTIIKEEIGIVPPKSACFFCLASKPNEISELGEMELKKIVIMEARAKPRLNTSEGLWRSTVKGCRGATPRPGSMTTFILEQGLLKESVIKRLQEDTPKDIVRFMDRFAEGEAMPSWHDFIESVTKEDMG
jgi:hypothetical protein